MESEQTRLAVTKIRHELFSIRRRLSFSSFCDKCGSTSIFISVEDAVALSGFSMRKLFDMANIGEVHFLESQQGILVICQKSIGANIITVDRADQVDL